MTAPQFVDISAFQPGQINWVAYRNWAAQWDGVSRVAMRSSYGVGYTDQHFASYRAGALAAGIDAIYYYHYAYPSFNHPLDEADYQRSVVGDIRPQDLIVLDFEENVSQATDSWAWQFLTRQEFNYGGKLPCLYASSSYVEQRLQLSSLAKYPLWLANWQYTPDERPDCPPPWSSYEFVQYTDRASNIPGIPGNVDCNIYFGGNAYVNTYGPGKGDFNNWFISNSDGSWTCKQFNTALMFGNKALYSQISIDGNALPIIGLPRTNELYQRESDGYQWSVQFFERGLIVYDKEHRQDSQPGFSDCYLGKYSQFMSLDPAYQPLVITKLPTNVTTDLQQIAAIADKYK